MSLFFFSFWYLLHYNFVGLFIIFNQKNQLNQPTWCKIFCRRIATFMDIIFERNFRFHVNSALFKKVSSISCKFFMVFITFQLFITWIFKAFLKFLKIVSHKSFGNLSGNSFMLMIMLCFTCIIVYYWLILIQILIDWYWYRFLVQWISFRNNSNEFRAYKQIQTTFLMIVVYAIASNLVDKKQFCLFFKCFTFWIRETSNLWIILFGLSQGIGR